MCDAVAAFPATQTEVTHYWINYTGCNSLCSTAADVGAVYVGGHELGGQPRRLQAHRSRRGPGGGHGRLHSRRPGGALITNPAGTAGLYSRSRGHGADHMLLTSAGLWIASDNFGGGTSCGGVSGFAGICFLPYSP